MSLPQHEILLPNGVSYHHGGETGIVLYQVTRGEGVAETDSYENDEDRIEFATINFLGVGKVFKVKDGSSFMVHNRGTGELHYRRLRSFLGSAQEELADPIPASI